MTKVITITLPKKLEKQLEGTSKSELERQILDFLWVHALEMEITESKDMQKGILELLASKSKLTKKDASRIARKIELSMAREVKSSGLL